MYPAFMLARNAGLRDTEIKTLTWGQVNLTTKTLQVGKPKSDAGEGRIVPLELRTSRRVGSPSRLVPETFSAFEDDWYLFPLG